MIDSLTIKTKCTLLPKGTKYTQVGRCKRCKYLLGFFMFIYTSFKAAYWVSDYIDSIKKGIELKIQKTIIVLCPAMTTPSMPFSL